MSEFVLATYEQEVKITWNGKVSDEWLIGLLFDAIVVPTQLTDKNGELVMVSKPHASELVNRKANVSPKIKKASSDSRVTGSIKSYFEKKIIPELQPNMEDELIHRINQLVQGDGKISAAKKVEIAVLANKNTYADFLSQSFLLAISRPNKLPKVASPGSTGVSTTELAVIPIPTGVTGVEGSYTDALLAAYGQVEGIKDFTVDMLDTYPAYKENFSNQRKYYFAAEAVRRGTRDLYSTKEKDQFEVLKDEMYEGVTEVWEDEAKNGLARMRKVMAQATKTSLDKCRICRDTEWVGNSQRKGVCHFLVGENRLKGWVRDDDEQAI